MKLEIGDKIYELEYTVNSVCDLEEITGKGLGDILSVNGMNSVRALLWSGLVEHSPTMTIKNAGKIMQEYMAQDSIEGLITKMGAAIEQAGFLNAQTAPKRAAKAVRAVK